MASDQQRETPWERPYGKCWGMFGDVQYKCPRAFLGKSSL